MTRKDKAKARLAKALLGDVDTEHDKRHYSYELMQTARLWPSRLYPLLDELLERGWVSDGWGIPDNTPRRLERKITKRRYKWRYYVVTFEGWCHLNTWIPGWDDDAQR
jgi:DNA-binding PadR family transcriptional regulator